LWCLNYPVTIVTIANPWKFSFSRYTNLVVEHIPKRDMLCFMYFPMTFQATTRDARSMHSVSLLLPALRICERICTCTIDTSPTFRSKPRSRAYARPAHVPAYLVQRSHSSGPTCSDDRRARMYTYVSLLNEHIISLIMSIEYYLTFLSGNDRNHEQLPTSPSVALTNLSLLA
jgi:hypothetical protein